MSGSGEDRAYWQGKIEERVDNKANRTELSDLYNQAQRDIAASEKRSADLVAASAKATREELVSIRAQLERNGAHASDTNKQLLEFIAAQHQRDDTTRESLATLREHAESQSARRINWMEWARWGFITALLIYSALSQNFQALLTFLK